MRRFVWGASGLLLMIALPACGDAAGGSKGAPSESTGSVVEACGQPTTPPTTPLRVGCERLATSLHFPNTTFTSSTSVAAGELAVPGQTIPAHCLLVGKMYDRVSPITGDSYSIGFELRLPLEWNRRFFYQANGGLDGNVVSAIGPTSGGGPLTSALLQGFAVISSDAGHNAAQNPTFGLDPQARLDYGYQAVGKLTPMAKSVIAAAYARWPSYSYIGGCSNGGRHAMVAAERYAHEYDGFLVGSPGFNLPKAGLASLYGGQQYASVAGGAVIAAGPYAGLPDLSAGFTVPEQQLVARKILERCDTLDGLADGLVQATAACQSAFNLARDVPTCTGARDGSCLTDAQKAAIAEVYAGPKDSAGNPIYASFPFDAGIAANGSQFWEFLSPLLLDSAAVGFVFATPPNPAVANPFALPSLDIAQLYASTYATDSTYTESSESFMVPPHLTQLDEMRRHGGRMIVYHGASDPIFSVADTAQWYSNLDRASKSAAQLYVVPGMNHCGDGPAVDQFDLLTPLVRWVEQGGAPEEVVASARGATNPGGANLDLPADWSPSRTRPLCPYPRIAVYRGGDREAASSFACRR